MIEPSMSVSATQLEATKTDEGLRLTAYQDAGGVWTIGYGHTGPDVTEGLTITPDRAEELLQQDMAPAQAEINQAVDVPLKQGEFDALVDFCYNVGEGAFETSTMRMLLNEGDYLGAAAQFERWDHVKGKVVAGLLRRRLQERDTFLADAGS